MNNAYETFELHAGPATADGLPQRIADAAEAEHKSFHDLYLEALADDAEDVEATYKWIINVGSYATSERVMLALALKEAEGKQPFEVVKLLLERIGSIITTLDHMQRLGVDASKSISAATKRASKACN